MGECKIFAFGSKDKALSYNIDFEMNMNIFFLFVKKYILGESTKT